jgi:hypothetical protein
MKNGISPKFKPMEVLLLSVAALLIAFAIALWLTVALAKN